MRRVWTMVLLLLWGNLASAAVIVSNGGKLEVSPGVWEWAYNVNLQPDQTFRTGDFFTIYDVPNIISGSVKFLPVSGSFSTQIAGTTPPDPAFAVTNDDPAINNIKVSLSSASTITPGTGERTLGTLLVDTTNGIPVLTNYAAQAGLNGNNNTNTGFVEVAAVPEPGSVTMMILGLVAFGAVAMRRRGN